MLWESSNHQARVVDKGNDSAIAYINLRVELGKVIWLYGRNDNTVECSVFERYAPADAEKPRRTQLRRAAFEWPTDKEAGIRVLRNGLEIITVGETDIGGSDVGILTNETVSADNE